MFPSNCCNKSPPFLSLSQIFLFLNIVITNPLWFLSSLSPLCPTSLSLQKPLKSTGDGHGNRRSRSPHRNLPRSGGRPGKKAASSSGSDGLYTESTSGCTKLGFLISVFSPSPQGFDEGTIPDHFLVFWLFESNFLDSMFVNGRKCPNT